MRAASWIAMACLLFGMVGCADESAPAPGKGPSVAATKPAAAAPAPAPAVKPAPVGTTTKPAPAVPAAAGPVVLEAEKCTLKDCAAKDLAGASGGKAVLMDKDSSEAQGTVELKKGKYKVVVYMQGGFSFEMHGG